MLQKQSTRTFSKSINCGAKNNEVTPLSRINVPQIICSTPSYNLLLSHSKDAIYNIRLQKASLFQRYRLKMFMTDGRTMDRCLYNKPTQSLCSGELKIEQHFVLLKAARKTKLGPEQ